MENNLEHIDNLIALVLSGEAGPEQSAELERWKTLSPENARYVEEAMDLFDRIDRFKTVHQVDTAKAWDRLSQRIGEQEAKVIPLSRKRILWQAAASVALLVALFVILRETVFAPKIETTVVASTTTIKEQKLPDGSEVVLNRNSEISYAVNKFNVREVSLKGEAYFEVVHNEEQPFIISIGSVVIKDIGTAFNVKALPQSDTIEVYVESGEVQFYYENNINSGFNLVKGEKAIYQRSTGKFTKLIPHVNDNTVSYRSKVFHFKGAYLKDVLRQINEVYGSDIQLSNAMLGNCRLSVDFDHENLEQIIFIISETLDWQVERSGTTILFKGQPCAD